MAVIRQISSYILIIWAIFGFVYLVGALVPDEVKEGTNVLLSTYWPIANGYLLWLILRYSAEKPAVSLGCVGLLATQWTGSILYFDGHLFTAEGLVFFAVAAVPTAVIFATNSKFKDEEWFEMKDQ